MGRDECARDRIVRPEFGGERPCSVRPFQVADLSKRRAEVNPRPSVTRIRLRGLAIDRMCILESAGRFVRHAKFEQ